MTAWHELERGDVIDLDGMCEVVVRSAVTAWDLPGGAWTTVEFQAEPGGTVFITGGPASRPAEALRKGARL
jgi:hypothetical protein